MCRYKKLAEFLKDGNKNKVVVKCEGGHWLIQYIYKNKLKEHIPHSHAELHIIASDAEKIIYWDGSISSGYCLLDKATNHSVSIEETIRR